MSVYDDDDDDDDGIKFKIGLDTNNPEKPVYFSFELDDGVWEFWFSFEEIKELVGFLNTILNDIKSGVAYDSRH